MVRKIILFVAITNFLKYAATFDTETSILNDNLTTCEHSSWVIPTHEWPLTGTAPKCQRRKWISQLFSEAEMRFDVHPGVNPVCREHFQLYKSHLENQTIWAVRMMDSTEWPSVGIFSGMTHHLGNWAECLKASGPKFVGRYCMVNAVVDVTVDDREFRGVSENSNYLYDEARSAWNVIKKYETDPLCIDRRKLRWALCVPSSCDSNDVKISLISTLNPIFRKNNLNITVDVVPTNCVTREETHRPQNSRGYSYTRKLYLVITCLVITASIYDSLPKRKTGEEDGSITKLLLCFSIPRNFESLVKCSTNMEYPAIHLIKIIGVISQSIAHRWMFSFRFGMFQTEEVEIELKSGMLFFLSMTNYMDVFFLISGFFLYRWCVEPMRKGGVKFLFISLMFRLMKMIPTLMIVILFMSFVLPNIGEGPYWNWSMTKLSDPCTSNGWMNLLAINNILPFREMCFIPSWHFAVDFQLSVIGSVLLLIFVKNEKLGITLISLTLAISVMRTCVVAYLQKFSGFYTMSMRYMNNEENIISNLEYTATYPRAGPYFVGVLAAYAVDKLMKKDYKFSSLQSTVPTVLLIVGATACQYYGFILMHETIDSYHSLYDTIFAGLYRIIFVLPFAYLLCIYFTSGLGIFSKLVDCKIYVPLGRLTYCVAMTDFVFLVYQLSLQRANTPTSQLNMYMWAISHIIISYIIGLVLYLMVDGPIGGLLKLLKQRMFQKKAEKKVN